MPFSFKIPVIEMFGPVIQGEGALAGHKTIFIRTGGCDLKCTWCDSMHAVDQQEIRRRVKYYTADDLTNEVLALGAASPWVTLSGGNPCLWPLGDLVERLASHGFLITVETQGTIWKEWLLLCDRVTVSPKSRDWHHLDLFYSRLPPKCIDLTFKVVCFTMEDLEFAEEVTKRYPKVPLYLSVGNSWSPPSTISLKKHRQVLLNQYAWITEQALKRPLLSRAIILPQLHVLMFGNEQGR